jgi:nucleotide-binding universal stress UspA family protein
MTFRHILLTIDRTQKTNAVFEEGTTIARKYDAHLTMLHCIADANAWAMTANVPTAGVGFSWPTAILPTATSPVAGDTSVQSAASDRMAYQTEIVHKWLQELQQKAFDAGCKDVTYEIQVGDPGDCICEFAKDSHTDLIIIGRKDRSSLEELVLGSVSNHVVHNAPCSVLVVQS